MRTSWSLLVGKESLSPQPSVPFLLESTGFIFIRQVTYEEKVVKDYASITIRGVIGTERDPLRRGNVIRET
jgi:hypothetical protein